MAYISLCRRFFLETQKEAYISSNFLVASPEVKQEKLVKQFHYGSRHSGFQVLLDFPLIMRSCEAGDTDTQVRERGDHLVQNQRRSLHRQRSFRLQELTFPLNVWGYSFHTYGEIPGPRRSLTNGENTLVYSSVPMCKYQQFTLRHKLLLIILLVFPRHTRIDS